MKNLFLTVFMLLTASFAHADILDQLKALPDVEAKELTSTVQGYRQFEILIVQPTDHQVAKGETFKQKLILLHKKTTEPMILQTSGYKIFNVKLSSPALLFGANQLQVEHRFFDKSIPSSSDWKKLDIWQSAKDFHKITQTFKTIYKTSWLNTGASKGGMTSVYHRRFFPDDLDGTLALVAPLSFSDFDKRYIDFVSNVGGVDYIVCRQKLLAVQNEILNRRNDILATFDGDYTQLGSKEIAFEHAVIELAFAFWQYNSPADKNCSNVPDITAPTSKLASFLSLINDVVDSYSDTAMATFRPYYFQAATQLGGPGADLASLFSLKFIETYKISSYTPKNVPVPYSNEEMLSVKSWVENDSEKIMFIYGSFDPWSAGAFPLRANADSYLYYAPKGNHGADVTKLSSTDKDKAITTLGKWLNKKAIAPDASFIGTTTTLEDEEFAVRKKFKLKL